MNDSQLAGADFPEVQSAVYGVALSLDAFLVNGIPFGILDRDGGGFLEKVAGHLFRDLASLQGCVARNPDVEVAETFAALRAQIHQLIALSTDLTSFRMLSREQLLEAVSRIVPLREECVRLIQRLEALFQTPGRFYPSRDAHLRACVDAFLASLPRLFADEWAAANPGAVA